MWRQIDAERDLDDLILDMLRCSAGAFAAYGVVMGLSQGLLQALASAIKLPLLFLLALAICLPTLYCFNLLCGGRLSVRQTLALTLSAITMTAIFTVVLAPITLFLLVTVRHYHLFVLSNVSVLALTGSVGLFYLLNGAHQLNALAQANDLSSDLSEAVIPPQSPRPVNMKLVPFWLALYGFVGVQLGWTLRPFIGMPDERFILFRSIEGDFMTSVVNSIIWLLR
jgi:hypothetical protein